MLSFQEGPLEKMMSSNNTLFKSHEKNYKILQEKAKLEIKEKEIHQNWNIDKGIIINDVSKM